jgi:hypothetical protein
MMGEMTASEMMVFFTVLVFAIGLGVVVRDALYFARHGTLEKKADKDS